MYPQQRTIAQQRYVTHKHAIELLGEFNFQ